MKNTVKVLAAVFTLAVGTSSFVAGADAAMTMKQCKMHHSEKHCLLTVHQHTSNDGNMSAPDPAKPAQ